MLVAFMIRHDAPCHNLERETNRFLKQRNDRCRKGTNHTPLCLVVSRTMVGLRADSMNRSLRVNRDLHRNRVIIRFVLEWSVVDASPVSMIPS